jgi:hypothetical protein
MVEWGDRIMTKLYAPPGLCSLGIDDTDYLVAADGTIDIGDQHLAAALAHGCRVEQQEPESAPAEAGVEGVLGRIEDRVAALEARLGQIEADTARRRRDPAPRTGL